MGKTCFRILTQLPEVRIKYKMFICSEKVYQCFSYIFCYSSWWISITGLQNSPFFVLLWEPNNAADCERSVQRAAWENVLWSWHPRISEASGHGEDGFWKCQFLFLYLPPLTKPMLCHCFIQMWASLLPRMKSRWSLLSRLLLRNQAKRLFFIQI